MLFRRRAALENDVEELAFSISEIGLLNPITLTKAYTLIAGLHRLEAVNLLGWTEIECTITDLEGLSAELAELDENFARKSFIEDTADVAGSHPSTIARHIKIASELTPEAKEITI